MQIVWASAGCLLSSGHTSGSHGNAERARAGSSEVIYTGSQKRFALGKIDFLVDLEAASLEVGVILVGYADFAAADHEVQRFSFSVVGDEHDLDVAVA